MERDIEEFEAELGRRGADPMPTINPDLARIPGTNEDPFPKVVGRTRPAFPDPSLRAVEELEMAASRTETIDQPK